MFVSIINFQLTKGNVFRVKQPDIGYYKWALLNLVFKWRKRRFSIGIRCSTE